MRTRRFAAALVAAPTSITLVAIMLVAGVSCSQSPGSRASATSGADVPNPPMSSSAPPPSAHATINAPSAMPLPAGTRRLHIDDAAAFVPMSGPYNLAIAPNAVWAAGGPYRIDPRSDAVGKALTYLGADVVAADGQSVWASAFDGNVARRFDARTGRLVAAVTLPGTDASADGIAITPTDTWVAAHHGGMVYRIDKVTDRIVGRVRVCDPGSSGPEFLAAGAGSIWAGVPRGAVVVRIDARSGKVLARIPIDDRITPGGDLAVTRTAVWMSESFAGTHVVRIDLRTNKVTSIVDTGGFVVQPAADGDAVWFVTGGDPRESPQTPAYLVKMRDNGSIAKRYALGPEVQPGGVVIGFGSIWVSSTIQPIVLRIPYPRS